MERAKLYIYAKNADYGEKLMRFLASRHNAGIDVELLTGIKDKEELERDAYLISDDEDAWEKINCRVIRLKATPGTVGKDEIFMYQSGPEIYRQILNVTGAAAQEIRQGEALSVPKVVCIFSPGESEEKTVFALRTAFERAERGTVLYMSMCGFPVMFEQESGEEVRVGQKGLSELMLCTDLCIFEEMLDELSISLGKLSVIAPAEHFRDLFDFTREEAMRFMEHLGKQTRYDTVVIETGQLLEFTFSVLAAADAVLVPQEPGVFAKAKRRLLKEYCERDGEDELWNRFQFVPVCACMPSSWDEIRHILYGEDETV